MEQFINDLFIQGKISKVDKLILEENIEALLKEFAFLKVSREMWIHIFKQIAEEMPSFNVDKFVKEVKKRFKKVIKINCNDRNVAILESYLFFSIKNNSYLKSLNALYEMLDKYHIDFDEEYFLKLKHKSKTFIKILQALGIDDFSREELQEFVYGKYNLEIALRPQNRSINWVRKIGSYVTKIMGLDWNFGNFSESQVSYIQKTDNFKKLKFILSEYDTFTYIYNEYVNLFGDTNRKVFDIVVFNYTLRDLKKLLEDFMRYKGLKNSYAQDRNLFNSIYSKIKNVVYEEKEDVKRGSHQKYFLIQSFNDLINALMEVIEIGDVNLLAKKDLIIRAYSMVDKKEELSLYLQGKSPKTPDVFWSLKHLQSYVEKKIATYDMYDYILKNSKDDPSKRELLDLVLAVNNFNKTDFDLYFKNKLTDIEKIMQIEEDLQELAIDYECIDNYQPTKSGNKKSYHDIYALFLGNLENDLDKRKELEEFLARQKPEGIALIKLYIINKLESKDLKMKARNHIYFLKNKFLNDKKEKIKKQRLTKYKNVYEYILKDKAYDELERLYLDEMLGQEKEDILNLIKAYFDGSLTKANKTKVVNKLSKIRAKYELFKENNIPISELNKKHNFANIYEYILREDVDNLEKRKIVDNLLLKLSKEDQKNIRLYYEDKLDDHEKRYITQRRLSYLRYKYKKTLNSSNKQTFKSKSRKRASDIYEYILKNEANNLEKRKILDEILNNLSKDKLKQIELYFDDKLSAKEINSILCNIRQKYKIYLSYNWSNLFNQGFIDQFIVLILIKHLSQEEREYLKEYLKTKKVNDLVNKLINLLQKSYDYYLNYGMLPSYYYLENIFMSVDLEWFKEEYNNLSDAKVKLLNEELKLIDYRLELDNPDNSLIEIIKKYKEEELNVLEIIARIKKEMLEEDYIR